MKIRSFLQRADFFRRHFILSLPYLTAKKVRNIALNEFEFRVGRTKLKSIPPFIKLESTPLCHLSCPGCVHSDKAFKKTLNNKMYLTEASAAAITDRIADRLLGISVSYSGEPLLNKDLWQIVGHYHRQNIYTSFPTNLSVPLSERAAERIVESGLDLMMVSLDGASKETYSRFRIGGNFDLVLRNVRLIADAKQRLGRKRPYLLWKFIEFPHNSHEVKLAKTSRKSLGFDGIEFDIDHDSNAAVAEQTDGRSVKPCFWAWNTATVAWNGDVQPCCKQMGGISLGNASDGLDAVWGSDAYAAFRKSFTQGDGADLDPVCRRCMGLAEPAAVAA